MPSGTITHIFTHFELRLTIYAARNVRKPAGTDGWWISVENLDNEALPTERGMTPVKHIVFDIGQVLIHYDPDVALRSVIPDAAERKWFFDNVCTHEWNIEQDRGRKWADAEAIDDSVVIMRQLIADGHDVTMLTNFASDTLREAWQRFPFLTESRGVTISGDIGLIKPDKAIYDHHAATFG
eukprot:gene22907-27467_t